MRLNSTVGKSTLRQNLESARRQMKKLGRTEAELDVMFSELKPVKLTRGQEHQMQTFLALCGTRTSGVNGASPITFLEIRAYCELTGEVLTPHDIETLRAMDRAFISAANAASTEED